MPSAPLNIATRGDPLEDIFNLTHVVLVVKHGKVISDERNRLRAAAKTCDGSRSG
jgi:hypothetical protein